MNFIVRLTLFVLAMCILTSKAKSDAGWWQTPAVRACCSEADAVYADKWELRGDKVLAEVTGGGPRNHSWAPIGRVFEVPLEKVIHEPGNPTGRAILFLRPSDLYVYCFVPGPLI